MHRLILTDINMPEIDGLQMSRMIKKSLFKLQNAALPNGAPVDPLSATYKAFPNINITEGSQNFNTQIYAVTAMNDD